MKQLAKGSLLGLFGMALALSMAGCSNPADDVTPAKVEAPAKKTAVTTQTSEGQYFAFKGESAKVEFIGSKVTGSHNGGFRTIAGEFRVVDGKLADTGNKIVIDVNSIWSDNDRLTGHLKSPDFFDAAKYPKAVFESTEVKPAATGSTVTGNLTLHGVTKQISFPAQIQVSGNELSAKSEFYLNRFDFNIVYPGKANDLIRKEVVLKLDIKATPGRAAFDSLEIGRASCRERV